MCLFQLLEAQKHHQSTQTHIKTQFWHPTWPCLIVNNTPISFSWIYLWPIFLTTQLNVKCSKIAKISKLKLWLLQKIIVKHLNPFKFSHCQQIPPLFFRRDSLTSYHLCNTRPMANVQLKVHSALYSQHQSQPQIKRVVQRRFSRSIAQYSCPSTYKSSPKLQTKWLTQNQPQLKKSR